MLKYFNSPSVYTNYGNKFFQFFNVVELSLQQEQVMKYDKDIARVTFKRIKQNTFL